jgi:hypothetical protein
MDCTCTAARKHCHAQAAGTSGIAKTLLASARGHGEKVLVISVTLP